MGDHRRSGGSRPSRRPPPPEPAASCAGFTLIEIVVALAILVFALLAVAGSASGNLVAVGSAKLTNRATHFVEETLDSVSEQGFDNLLLLNGNLLYDHTDPAAARYRVVLTVSEATVDLITVKATLLDNRSQRQIARFVTYRSRR